MSTSIERKPRLTAGDVVFALFATAFGGGATTLLALGVGAVLAHGSPALHESLHLVALGSGPLARAAIRMADASHIAPSAIALVVDYSFSLFNIVLAVFMLWLRPRDRTARLLAIGMFGTAAAFNLWAQNTYEIVALTRPETILAEVNHIITGVTYVAALLLFPDGRIVPRWSRKVLIVLYAPLTLAVIAFSLRVEGGARPSALIMFFGLVIPIAGVSSQAYRFRHSPSAAEHQQARLLFWSLLPALALGLYFVFQLGVSPNAFNGLAGRPLGQLPQIVFRVFQPLFAFIPIALFVGLLRYRLWDLDRVINRTLVYFGVTAVLGGGYFGIVVLLQPLIRPFVAGNDLAVAGSTLAVAAAFGPVRRRLQNFVDKRFNRWRYDAAQTMAIFGHDLRDEIDLDTMSIRLQNVVLQTMQPEHVSLWLRPSSDRNEDRNVAATGEG